MNRQVIKTIKSSLVLIIITAVLVVGAVSLRIVLAFINKNEIAKEAERREYIDSLEIPKGVTVNGIDVSGLKYSEAVDKLKNTAELDIAEKIKFTLTYEDQEYILDSDDFVIEFNTEDVVKKTLGMIQDGGYLAVKNYVDSVKKNGIDYSLEYTIDAEHLEESLLPICEQIYVEPQNAKAEVKSGFKASYSSVVNSSPFRFIEDVDGLEVNKEELINTLIERIENQDFGVAEVPTTPLKAQINLDDIKANTVLLSYFHTSYSSSTSDRSENVARAAARINGGDIGTDGKGICVNPGETFSMEGTIGRRVGPPWKMAPAVVGGGSNTENQYGGGVCQVSTTLYNVVLRADLEIVYRKNHTKASTYVDPGLDCTINTDTIDFLWKNNTDYDVYVFAWTTSSKDIYCAIYGRAFPSNFDRIELGSTLLTKTDPGPTEYIKKSSFKEGEWFISNEAITGYKYQSYAYYYKGSQLVDTKQVDTSTYNMHPKRYYVWSSFKVGDYLDPYKEMVKDSDGNYVRKRTKPVATPTPEPTPMPNPTAEPITDPNANTIQP